ncbi:hypothetical protein PENTCL1PPCAC_10938, partial [Pristionchus entomophagus]
RERSPVRSMIAGRSIQQPLDGKKLEQAIFNEFASQPDPERTQHFLKMIDKGKTECFKFIVMTLVSHSLDDLRRHYLESLAWSSTFNIALQTLKAIEDLHACGFLHRDIKPHNFAIGVPPKDTTIFMIDFGIARRYVETDGKLRIPRQGVRFLGTVRFASRSCHNEREQARKDDLESWCYMIIDLFNPDNITWRRVTVRTKVAVCKHQLFTRADSKEIDAPKVMIKSIAYVNDLRYADAPDYEKIRGLLNDGAKEDKFDLTKKFDWVGVELKKKLSSKKKGPLAANKITDDEDDTEPSMKKKKEERRKRFSMENEDSSELMLAKLPARRTISKLVSTALVVPPSSKARQGPPSGFALPRALPGGPVYPVSMSKPPPPPSGVRMATALGP